MSPERTYPAPIALATPEPGDLACLPVSGWAGLGIEVGQFLDGDKFEPYEHVEIYVGQADLAGPYGYTVSAYPDRQGRRPLPCQPALLPGSLWSSGIVPLTADQRLGIVAWCNAHEHVGYSGLDYVALAAHRLHLPVPGLREYIGNTGHMQCAYYCDTAWTVNDVHMFSDHRWPGYVTPGDISGLLESKMPPKKILI